MQALYTRRAETRAVTLTLVPLPLEELAEILDQVKIFFVVISRS
jgi:hypothetical protein